uniref:Methyltransferase n=1 Tax=viral metagenome TaxID=1070528 RepID=A0A6H2A2Y1_9ZZZZ
MVTRMCGAGVFTWDQAVTLLDHGRWTGKHVLIERWLDKPMHWRKPRVVAAGWLGDMWLADNALLDRMMPIATRPECGKHQFLVLTKRAEMMEAKARRGYSIPYSNHWFGATVCNQAEADKQIPHLLRIPGKRWLCIEPLLESVDLSAFLGGPYMSISGPVPEGYNAGISWVVVGQETGPGARPAKPEWIQSVIDQCHAAGVPCWTKALPLGVEPVREAPEPIAAILRREGMMEGT